MTFTDEDLLRLKEEFNRGFVIIERDGERIDEVLEGLLARLEAAEEVLLNLRGHEAEIVDEDLMARWRKVARK